MILEEENSTSLKLMYAMPGILKIRKENVAAKDKKIRILSKNPTKEIAGLYLFNHLFSIC